jgi:amino acid permease
MQSQMLASAKAEKNRPRMSPMSPIAASATVINLILATGPFTYPQAFSNLGPVISLTLLVITAILSYISSTYIVEIISCANAMRNRDRLESLFGEDVYKSPVIQGRFN